MLVAFPQQDLKNFHPYIIFLENFGECGSEPETHHWTHRFTNTS